MRHGYVGFTVLVVAFASLELPRYALMASVRHYSSRRTYACHLAAAPAYFAALSAVFFVWVSALGRDAPRALAAVSKGLALLNVVFVALIAVEIALCLDSFENLEQYQRSTAYFLLTVFSAGKNLALSSLTLAFTTRVLGALREFARVHAYGPLLRMTRDLIGAMTVCTACFAVRIIFLVFKASSSGTARSARGLSAPSFSPPILAHQLLMKGGDRIGFQGAQIAKYGEWWFVLSDFIPRCVPAATLLVLVASKVRCKPKTPLASPI